TAVVACMRAGQVLLAGAEEAWHLSLAIAFWGTAIGFADSQAEMALVQSDPERIDRSMARRGIPASLCVGGSWRSVPLVSAVLALVDAILVWRGPDFDRTREDDEEVAPLREAIAAFARGGDLLWWLFAGATCALLDEVFVVFGCLYVVASGGSLPSAALEFAAYAIGGVAGLALAERSGLPPRRVLQGTAL